jgi:hypothetical protein
MADGSRTFPIPDAILVHRPRMGSSIWEYLWLRAHVTSERECDGEPVGIVDGGRPVPTNRIAAELRRSRETTLANMGKLAAGNYIERLADAGHAYSYRVRVLLEDVSD